MPRNHVDNTRTKPPAGVKYRVSCLTSSVTGAVDGGWSDGREESSDECQGVMEELLRLLAVPRQHPGERRPKKNFSEWAKDSPPLSPHLDGSRSPP